MRKFLLLIFANLLFLGLVICIYALGYEYDRASGLKQRVDFGDVTFYAYGERWRDISFVLIGVGALIDLVLVAMWFIKRKTLTGPIIEIKNK